MRKRSINQLNIKSSFIAILILFCFLISNLNSRIAAAQGQITPSTNTSKRVDGIKRDELTSKLKLFVAPEAGLNNEIRAALMRIEQACDLSKSKLKDPLPFSPKNLLVIREIAVGRELIAQQQTQWDKAQSAFRTERGLNNKICATAIDFFPMSEQCTRYQNDTSTLKAVSSIAEFYYAEALARYSSYEAAIELESLGCARPDFGVKLWSAEQLHIIPKLKTSADQLANFLK